VLPAFAASQDRGAAESSSSQVEWYGPVRAGEDLGHIAQSVPRAPGIALEQVMVAFYQANAGVFAAADLHSLRAGVRLRVPSAKEIAAVSRDEALRWVHGGHVLLPAISVSAEQLKAQLEELEKHNATLDAERETLRQRVVAMEQQVRNLSQKLASDPSEEKSAPEVQGYGGAMNQTVLLAGVLVVLVLAGLGFWFRRWSAGKISS
jgi:FimV-like protein